jgi:DNA invertase Pin-like site-specific DNA recombinase
MEHTKQPVRRCAIYTRKSSEEGLEQDFNSLQAQREACEAFIRSQAGEGWRLGSRRPNGHDSLFGKLQRISFELSAVRVESLPQSRTLSR